MDYHIVWMNQSPQMFLVTTAVLTLSWLCFNN
jgi:hypothetical protein